MDPTIFNIQTNYYLVGGHQRVDVAQDLSLFYEIDVSVVYLPLHKEKSLNLALNKILGWWSICSGSNGNRSRVKQVKMIKKIQFKRFNINIEHKKEVSYSFI